MIQCSHIFSNILILNITVLTAKLWIIKCNVNLGRNNNKYYSVVTTVKAKNNVIVLHFYGVWKLIVVSDISIFFFFYCGFVWKKFFCFRQNLIIWLTGGKKTVFSNKLSPSAIIAGNVLFLNVNGLVRITMILCNINTRRRGSVMYITLVV